MNLQRLIVLTIFFVLILSSCSQSQVIRNDQKDMSAQPKYEWLSMPFDSSVDRLAPGFWGHSVIEIYNALSLTKAGSIESAPLFGSFYRESQLAFRDELYLTQLRYNSDTEKLNIRIKTTDLPSSWQTDKSKEESAAILMVTINRNSVERLISESGRDTSTREARIESFQLSTIFVDINRSDRLRLFFSPNGDNIDLSPEKAEDIQKKGSVLFIGNLIAPFVTRDAPEPDPTKTESSNVLVQKGQVYLRVTEIWLYNKNTGEIYTKVKY